MIKVLDVITRIVWCAMLLMLVLGSIVYIWGKVGRMWEVVRKKGHR